MRMTFKEVKDKIKKMVPKDLEYEVELESASIAIVTPTPRQFDRGGLLGRIGSTVKRRIVLRPSDDILMPEEEAEIRIREEIPDGINISVVHFDRCLKEVLVQCDDPRTAVGKRGAIREKLQDETGWMISIERTPPLESKTTHDIRGYRRAHWKERKKLLKEFGLNIYRPKRAGPDWVRLTALGSYREVGRACHYITTNESRVMIDVGVNIASDTDPMPYFNAPEALPLEKLDAVVLTHAHLDHAGMLPVLFKYGYRGPVFCTPPTRDMMLLLQTDYLKVTSSEGKRPPYEMEHIRECIKHVVDVDWNQTTDIAPDIKLTFHNAGHILGSSSVHLHIGDGVHNIVLSGDTKFEKSWLFDAANCKFPRCETLVIESTYGAAGDFQPSRAEATMELQDVIRRTMKRNGKVICPVFAVGRSQEVMIAIDELFRSGEVEPVPVYLDG
ncbi:MAG: MBL fold metallo-hydrolase, partial [Candidatus Poseidoniaceae archaeon]|nr:MBL fold metallo-hydrolase [Candidatus Poseidoniaceae archaeon]